MILSMILGVITIALTAVLVAVAFVLGGVLSFILWQTALRNKRRAIIREAETEAEVIKKDKILQAKEKFLQLKADHEQWDELCLLNY